MRRLCGAPSLSDEKSLLVLVDAHDIEAGLGEKIEVHRFGLLHRAVSVFIFDGAGRMLLQKRSSSKYHSRDLWSNSCCTHPHAGEPVLAAAHRRLGDEMGFDCELHGVGAFIYRAEVGNGLIEHEYDHLFVGRYDGNLRPNAAEVSGWKWEHVDVVIDDVASDPRKYSAWFPLALHELETCGVLRTFLSQRETGAI